MLFSWETSWQNVIVEKFCCHGAGSYKPPGSTNFVAFPPLERARKEPRSSVRFWGATGVYHPFQNHYTHKKMIFELFRSLQLQLLGPTELISITVTVLAVRREYFLYSYSSSSSGRWTTHLMPVCLLQLTQRSTSKKSCGIPREQAILRKSKAPRKSPEKWTFLSLAFYNAPSLPTVKQRRKRKRKQTLREIAPRVSTRWQISLLLVDICVKNVVKFRWQILSLCFLGWFS